ncbi:MAG: A/G-specific adenine glycosylase [Nocardioides sp.]
MGEDVRPVHEAVLQWYAAQARDLPWRRDSAGPWAVMVSEFMLRQTPVARVLPVFAQWMERWPAPADLAAEPPGEAVRAWGRLGYPRRALRLHAAANLLVERHGVGCRRRTTSCARCPGSASTASAIAAFAHGHRAVVLDTNVRRVLARVLAGTELPTPSVTRAERNRAEALLPAEPLLAARWSVAVMELGALVCTTAIRRAATARCRSRAGGWRPGDPRTRVHRRGDRPGPGPTGSVGAD